MVDRKSYWKEYHKKNKNKSSAWIKGYYRKMRTMVINALGGRCIKCGFDDVRALQVDHISGGGRKDKLSITRTYWRVVIESYLANEGKYQLLCANCNWIKRFENNETR